MTSMAERKVQLQERLAALTERVQATEAELSSHEAKDWEDLAIEREGDEVLETMGLGAQEEIRAVQAALQRIEAGVYGICQSCGATISPARLDVLPYTPFCKDCAP